MNWNSRWGIVVATATFISGNLEAEADLIAYWDFNDSNLLVDQGVGTLSTNFPAADLAFSTGTSKNAIAGVPAGQALRVENAAHNGIGYVDFLLNTRGYSGLVMSLATQKTSTGFSANQVSYSADGGAQFSSFGASYNPPTSFDLLTFDFSTIAALNENPTAVVRLTFDGATTATGNNRIDNVQFRAETTATPEPASWLMAALASLLLIVRGVFGRIRGAEQAVVVP